MKALVNKFINNKVHCLADLVYTPKFQNFFDVKSNIKFSNMFN